HWRQCLCWFKFNHYCTSRTW
ncbi:DUF3709 domain-containing protein, partial [Klebsiella pneumoniae]